jgi:hypothetical protein
MALMLIRREGHSLYEKRCQLPSLWVHGLARYGLLRRVEFPGVQPTLFAWEFGGTSREPDDDLGLL